VVIISQIIAPCGLDCSVCPIHLAPTNPEIAEELTTWFRKHYDSKAESWWFHCKGCPGDRDDHWSPNCEILHCCVDKKNLHYCCECEEFVCGKLKDFMNKGEKYAQAIERLKEGDSNIL